MSQRWLPDIVIGIDFGMTCTGVAYSTGPEWAEPKWIQNWPGLASYETRDKVDTTISYRDGQVVHWGFASGDDDSEELQTEEFFKLFLDPSYSDMSGNRPRYSDARIWYRDFLAELYHYIMQTFRGSIVRFRAMNVEFVFSIPTTWKNDAMNADIERLIHEAGFGGQPNERVSISLTEAEAAAIYAAQQNFRRGELFIVCDAGGGTTDLNVLKVRNIGSNRTELEPLHHNEGRNVGSTCIDYEADKIITPRLDMIRPELSKDPKELAREMLQDRFEDYKCKFDDTPGSLPKVPLPIPGMAAGRSYPRAGVENSSLVLTKSEVQSMFDKQIEHMYQLIDEQLKYIREFHPEEAVAFLILSGGLCSSPYVQRRLRQRYEGAGNSAFVNARGMEVLVARKPQLAVTLGLVHERIQTLKGGIDILSTRRSPASYGIMGRELYDEKRHQGEDVERDPFDKKRWAERQIIWFVKKGDVVSIKEPIQRRFRYKFALGQERDIWRTRIVSSFLDARELPRSPKHGGVQHLCVLKAALDRRDMTLQSDKWYQWQKPYWLADFQVQMHVGTGLKFEIIGANGVRSHGHEDINVEWESADEQRQYSTEHYSAETFRAFSA